MADITGIIRKINKRELAESYAAGSADSRRFLALYRAYLRGAYDAAGCREEENGANAVKVAVCAMGFALLGWIVTMVLVFK